MSTSKVVWTEGMFLRPQHFQQFERYLEHYVQLRVGQAQGAFWGFRRLNLDREALAIGKVVIESAEGVMPDGTPFSFANVDEAPPALAIGAQVRNTDVVLALPRRRHGAEDVVFEEAGPTLARFLAHDCEVQDSGAVAFGPAELQVGRLRLRLMLASELNDEWVALRVARVVELASEHRVLLDEASIGPALSVGHQPLLMRLVNELHGLLETRADALAARLGAPARGQVSEVSDFLLLALINRYLGTIWHARQFPDRHPQALFHDWIKLACDLATYTSPDRRPQVWPEYRHDDMAPAFFALMAELRRSLSTVMDQSALQIALVDRGQGVRVAQVPDVQLLRTAGFVLAVHAEMPGETVRTRFPMQVKIGPVERIRDLVHLQLPGISVRAMPSVPRQIPYHAGYTYFELEKTGDFWSQLERSGALALHLAGEFPGLSIEFWAIRA